MRPDMAKVICERQRSGGDGGKSIPPKGTKKRIQRSWKNDGEGFRKQESSARHRVYGHNAKSFGELLGPLEGFLLSRVGHKWDDVYSEVCQHIDKGNLVQKHILTHLFDYIALDVHILKGKVYYSKPPQYRRYGETDFPYTQIHEEFYVHPVTKVICRYKRVYKKYKRSYSRPVPGTYIYESKDKCYVRDLSGIWWGCEMKAFGEPRLVKLDSIYASLCGGGPQYTLREDTKYDEYLKKEVSKGDYILRQTYNCDTHYCWRKQQLNKAKIRKLLRLDSAKRR